MICPKCGTENGERNGCLKCGEFLRNVKTKRQVDPAEVKKMRRRKVLDFIKSFFLSFVIIVLAFIVLSAIMFVVFYFVFDNMDLTLPDDENPFITEPSDSEETAESNESSNSTDEQAASTRDLVIRLYPDS